MNESQRKIVQEAVRARKAEGLERMCEELADCGEGYGQLFQMGANLVFSKPKPKPAHGPGGLCEKVEHRGAEDYGHSSNDDTPYEVEHWTDGIHPRTFCGRCHAPLTDAEAGEIREREEEGTMKFGGWHLCDNCGKPVTNGEQCNCTPFKPPQPDPLAEVLREFPEPKILGAYDPDDLDQMKLRNSAHACLDWGNDLARRLADITAQLRRVEGESKEHYENACKTISDMHSAAMAEMCGPQRGVVEDVIDLRKRYDDQGIDLERYHAAEAAAREGIPEIRHRYFEGGNTEIDPTWIEEIQVCARSNALALKLAEERLGEAEGRPRLASLEITVLNHYGELFPDYAYTGAWSAVDLMAAEIKTLRAKEELPDEAIIEHDSAFEALLGEKRQWQEREATLKSALGEQPKYDQAFADVADFIAEKGAIHLPTPPAPQGVDWKILSGRLLNALRFTAKLNEPTTFFDSLISEAEHRLAKVAE